jgi:aryl sulfotransferase
MSELRRYRSLVMDSVRWEGFAFREDDIVISTPPKCGTTWTQMLCALLIFDTTELPAPLATLSPWIDMQLYPRDEIVDRLEAQQHRRFIKTHTPLDGIPRAEGVTYLCVGRDPRDVSLSWEHHMANIDLGALLAARAEAVGMDDLAELGPMPEPPPEDPVERFWLWALSPSGVMAGTTLGEILHHLQTFWDHRDEPDIALFHYSDLSADLPGQMRRLADVLQLQVAADRVEELAAAATFDSMKSNADRVAPNSDRDFWLSTTDFFHKGSNGQWRHLLDDEGVQRYDARVAELAPPDLAAWAHRGWLG